MNNNRALRATFLTNNSFNKIIPPNGENNGTGSKEANSFELYAQCLVINAIQENMFSFLCS